jgi:hypothetical protein
LSAQDVFERTLEEGQLLGENVLYAEARLGELLEAIKTKPIADSSANGTFGGSQKTLPPGNNQKAKSPGTGIG